jgi:hypothetical protein
MSSLNPMEVAVLSREQQVIFQRGEAELTLQLEDLLRALVGACDTVNPKFEQAMSGWVNGGVQCDNYLRAVEKGRAQLATLEEHRKKFAEAMAESAEPQRGLAGGRRLQSFEALQHGVNWRDLKGGRR